MQLEQIIPHLTKYGNEYLIKFDKFENENPLQNNAINGGLIKIEMFY